MTMSIREAILTRHTVQKYSTDPIPEGCIRRAIECALRAPNHKLTNPWRFRQVGPQTRGPLVEIGVELKREKAAQKGREFDSRTVDQLRAKLGNSPGLLIVTQVRTDDPQRSREDYAACACAIQNLMLSLWGEGVGSKWSSGQITRDPRTYELTQIDPEVEEIIAFVWVGHSSTRVIEVPRRPIEEVFFQLP